MGYWPINLLCIFILCVLLAGFLIPQILLIAFRRNLFDEVNERKIHKGLVPRLGGIAFVPVIFTSIAVALVTNIQLGFDNISQAFADSVLPFISTFIALELLYLVGMADDLIGIKYRAKFVVQIICAAFLISSGVWFSDLAGVLGIESVSPWFGYPFTLIVIVFLINAINLIDGIDGLASGLSSIVLVPFYYYNVFGDANKHKKIFMGDTGSLTIGLILAVLGTILFIHPDSAKISISTPILAFSPLIVPCFDVIRVYMLRIRQHHSPFLPDKNHIHHKILAAGMKPRAAMITIVSVSLMFTVINVTLSSLLSVNINIIIILDILLWGLSNIYLSRLIKKRNVTA